MKRIIWLTLSLILVLPLAGCSDISWIDFIKISDITYVRANQVVYFNERDLSTYDKIRYKVAGNVYNPDYKIQNGDAAFIEEGTPVYSIPGYAPDFRLVVRYDNEWLIYEADTNPKARKGSDLLDIGGKVESISIDRKTELASIKDQTQVNELILLILEAPVDQTASDAGSELYFLVFHP